MSNSQAIQAIENVLATSKVGVLSTAYNNKPNSRYMVFIMMVLLYILKRISILLRSKKLKIIQQHMFC